MRIIRSLFKYITSFFDAQPREALRPILLKEKIPMPAVQFKTLYLIGDDFYSFHEDVNLSGFISWLKEEQVDWYNRYSKPIKAFRKLSFADFIEQVYRRQIGIDDVDLLCQYLLKWYLGEHRAFRFRSPNQVFVTTCANKHLLQVLYAVAEGDIITIDAKEKIHGKLTDPIDYKNNWFIGTNSYQPLIQAIARYLVSNADRQTAHYKLITLDAGKNDVFRTILSQYGITNYIEPAFTTMTTIPNDKVTKHRFRRYDKFNAFAEKAEDIFLDFLDANPKAYRFQETHMLSVWSDKQHEKNDHTFVNVAFGSRAIIVSHHDHGFSTACEEGARLVFARMETGFVSVTLYPAKTEQRKPFEDAIIIKLSVDPADLLDKKKLKCYWRPFIAYMECTSLDGDMSWCQKQIIRRLRFYNHMIVNNVFQPTRRSQWSAKILNFALSVGLSGFLLAIIQITYNRYHPDLNPERNTQTVIHHIDSTQNCVIQSLDSIQQSMPKHIIECELLLLRAA